MLPPPPEAIEHCAHSLVKSAAWVLLQHVFAQRANQALSEPLVQALGVEDVPGVAGSFGDNVVRSEFVHADYA